MKLNELPQDVLHMLVQHLSSAFDYHSLVLTCRAVSNVLHAPSSHTLAILASRPLSEAFQPFPLTVLAFKGRILANWAADSSCNREALLEALTRGQQAVADLAFSVSPLTTTDLLEIRRIKRETLIPTIRNLDVHPNIAGDPETTILPNQFRTVQELHMYCVVAYWAYCELFYIDVSHPFRPFLPASPGDPVTAVSQSLGIDLRRAWMSTFVAVKPDHRRSCTCDRHPKLERELARELNATLAQAHHGSCLILSHILRRCVLVMKIEVIASLQSFPPDPDVDDLTWGELCEALGALCSLGLGTMRWLLMVKAAGGGEEWLEEIRATLIAVQKAGLGQEALRTLENDLDERCASLLKLL